MTTPRPVVKKTYGSRKSVGGSGAVASGSSPAPSRRTTSTSSLAPTSSPSRLRPHRTTLNNPDWAEAVAETFEGDEVMASGSGGGAKGKGRVRETTPAAAHEEQEAPVLEGRVLRERKTPSKVSGFSSSSSAALPAAKGDLRSFFNRASPRKKRRLSSPSSDGDDLAPPMSRSSTSSSSTSASSAFSNATTVSTSSSKPLSKSSSKPVKLEQLYLDPFETAGRSTLSCTVCSLSYARTPDDQAFHAKHHKKVVSGCDWNVGEEARGVTVLEDGVEWGGKEGGKVLMVDYPVTDAATKRKLKDVLETIDTELSSTSLTPSQLAESKVFLFVTPQRKVCAAAVVQRIKVAFAVVTRASDSAEEKEDEDVKPSADLLRFGEDQGAIFCAPTPLPTLLGIQRIWTSTSSRRSGLASLLLNHVATSYIYGCPIPVERRRVDFAFSQPTGKGQMLAQRWTGTKGFRVFVD